MKPQLQFHQAHAHCLDCHSEHKGYAGTISKVDHTLFNGELACTQCHFDAHNGKFGRDCRACHEITTWEIDGFRHPSSDNRDCHRCHAVPTSHEKEAFLKELKKRDMEDSPEETIKECWGCHTIYRFYGIAQND
ncbi:MAG: hypothetical protein SWH68_10905 [Thermodesulfobacteriota bacterium]|nr:hypothetical protein [Thermodesulfobacteriota bacterium]